MATDSKQHGDSSGSVKTHLHEAVDEVADQVSSMKARARDGLEATLKDLRAAMTRHPIATVAIGFGAGYVLARLLARR